MTKIRKQREREREREIKKKTMINNESLLSGMYEYDALNGWMTPQVQGSGLGTGTGTDRKFRYRYKNQFQEKV